MAIPDFGLRPDTGVRPMICQFADVSKHSTTVSMSLLLSASKKVRITARLSIDTNPKIQNILILTLEMSFIINEAKAQCQPNFVSATNGLVCRSCPKVDVGP